MSTNHGSGWWFVFLDERRRSAATALVFCPNDSARNGDLPAGDRGEAHPGAVAGVTGQFREKADADAERTARLEGRFR